MALPAPLKKLLIATLSVVIFFVLVELGLRVAKFTYPPTDEPITIWNRLEDRDLRLGQGLHRTEQRTLWGPRPSAEIPPRWSKDEYVNAAGYRGPQLRLEKTPGVLRIATLGDSSTFGYGVPYESTYSAQLEAQLKARGIACEVLDAGVVGYTVRQGLERYKRLVRDYKPDIVIEAFGAVNDHHPAQGGIADKDKLESDAAKQGLWTEVCLRVRHDLLLSHLFCKLGDDLGGGKGAERDQLFRKEGAQERISKYMGRIDFEKRGKRRVALEDFRVALLQLQTEVTADGGRLVLLSMPRLQVIEKNSPILPYYSRLLREIAEKDQLPIADGRAAFARAISAGSNETDLYIPDDSFHPSRAGHALLSDELTAVIAELLAQR